MVTRTGLVRLLLAAGLASMILVAGLAPAQGELPPPRILDQPDRKSSNGPQILPLSYPGGMYPGIPVTLPDVLRLTVLANLDITRANLVVAQARVALFQAFAQFVPNVSVGSTYVAHDGQIQNTAGNVQTVDRDSLFVGGGPSLTLPFNRVLFGPQEARQLRDAALAGRARVTNEVLLQVVDAYFELLRARRQLARLDEVLDFLTSEERTALRGGAPGMLPLIKAFVQSGEKGGLPSDQARVEVEVVRRQAERVRALEDVRRASAELSRLLHLNPGYFLVPAEDYRWPLEVPGKPWFSQPVDVLVPVGLSNRPELAENQALLAAAITRYRAARWQPLVPTLASTLSWGGFGGGPAVVGKSKSGGNVLGNSGVIANFGTRTDFDISLFWRLDNGGLGNLAQIRAARLRTSEAEVRQLQLQDRVVSEIVRAMEQVQRSEQRINIYRAGLFDDQKRPNGAVYRSIRLNFYRIFNHEGIPLESLDSIRRLSDVLEGYANSLSDYDRGRYRLLLVMGLPPAGLLDPSILPMPPCPPAAPPAAPPRSLPPPRPVAEDKKEVKQPAAPAAPVQPVVYPSPPPPPPPAPVPASVPGESQGVALPPIGQGEPAPRSSVQPRHLPGGLRPGDGGRQ